MASNPDGEQVAARTFLITMIGVALYVAAVFTFIL